MNLNKHAKHARELAEVARRKEGVMMALIRFFRVFQKFCAHSGVETEFGGENANNSPSSKLESHT